MFERPWESAWTRTTCRLDLATSVGVVIGWLVVVAPSAAGVLAVAGNGQLIDPPSSVAQDVLTDNVSAMVFEERSGYTLPTAIGVDWDASIATDGNILEGIGLFPGVIPAGTVVDSFFVHYDTDAQLLGSTLTFVVTDAPILGVILTPDLLDDSDGTLGAPGTFYPGSFDFRGTAGQASEADQVLISFDLMSITIYSTVEAVFDQLRVITAPGVPEPSALALWLAGSALGLALGRKRHRVVQTNSQREPSQGGHRPPSFWQRPRSEADGGQCLPCGH